MNTNYAFAENKRSEVTREEISLKNNQLLKEEFNEVIKEQDNKYKTLWKNETRPLDWQLRKWTGAAATGNNISLWGGCLR